MIRYELIYQPKMDSNCYLLTDDVSGECAMIDVGEPDGEAVRIAKRLGDKLKYILLTHGHFDHILGAKAAREASGAQIVIHTLEKDALHDGTRSLMALFGRIIPYELDCCDADITVGDGDIIKLGESEIKVLHVPGHSQGSVCYVADNYMFSGDMLFENSIGRTDFPYSDVGQMRESIERLLAIETDYTVCPGHGATTTLFREKKFNPYLR